MQAGISDKRQQMNLSSDRSPTIYPLIQGYKLSIDNKCLILGMQKLECMHPVDFCPVAAHRDLQEVFLHQPVQVAN